MLTYDTLISFIFNFVSYNPLIIKFIYTFCCCCTKKKKNTELKALSFTFNQKKLTKNEFWMEKGLEKLKFSFFHPFINFPQCMVRKNVIQMKGYIEGWWIIFSKNDVVKKITLLKCDMEGGRNGCWEKGIIAFCINKNQLSLI